MTEAYPLQWPVGRPRTSYPSYSKFGARSIDQATKILLHEINLLGGEDVIISSNMRLRRDGLPYTDQPRMSDKGIAVYFTFSGKQRCFACDSWDKMQDNLYAVAKTIEALRGIARWGSGDMVEQAFTGFLALPAPRNPYDVLGIAPGASITAIEEAYRRKAREVHPDTPGGSESLMADLNLARDRLRKGAA